MFLMGIFLILYIESAAIVLSIFSDYKIHFKANGQPKNINPRLFAVIPVINSIVAFAVCRDFIEIIKHEDREKDKIELITKWKKSFIFWETLAVGVMTLYFVL